jgi:uncharacterized protein related to proFAR isomerase
MTIAPTILAPYVDDIAFVAGEKPATTPAEFVEQLTAASERLTDAGINGAEDLETAATYLADANALTGTERRVLLNRAVKYLKDTDDMVDEYRDMV